MYLLLKQDVKFNDELQASILHVVNEHRKSVRKPTVWFRYRIYSNALFQLQGFLVRDYFMCTMGDSMIGNALDESLR